MNRLKKLINTIIFPKALWRIIIIIAGFGALLPAFNSPLKDTPIAIIAYVFSAYALIVTVAWGSCIYKTVHIKVKKSVNDVAIVNKYFTDHYFKVLIGISLSLIINLGFAALKMVHAILQSSVWNGAIAGYYIQLCMIRYYLTTQLMKAGKSKNSKQEFKAYRATAVLLFITNLILSVIVTRIVREGKTYVYPGYMIYASAAHTFYSLSISIYNTIKYNKYDSPLLSAAKTINLTTALAALFSLQTAMITEFSAAGEETWRLNQITGTVVCVLVLLMAAYMLLRSHKNLKGGL